MPILYVIGSLNLGGSERHLVHLATHLDHTRFKPMICCLVETGPLFAVAQSRGVSCVCLHLRLTRHRIGTAWRLARGIARLIYLMRRERVVIVHAYLFLAYVLAIPCAWAARVPVRIAQRRGLHTSKPPWSWRHRLERIVNRLTTQVVANSRAVARWRTSSSGVTGTSRRAPTSWWPGRWPSGCGSRPVRCESPLGSPAAPGPHGSHQGLRPGARRPPPGHTEGGPVQPHDHGPGPLPLRTRWRLHDPSWERRRLGCG